MSLKEELSKLVGEEVEGEWTIQNYPALGIEFYKRKIDETVSDLDPIVIIKTNTNAVIICRVGGDVEVKAI